MKLSFRVTVHALDMFQHVCGINYNVIIFPPTNRNRMSIILMSYRCYELMVHMFFVRTA